MSSSIPVILIGIAAQPSGQIEDAYCLYETIEDATSNLYEPLSHLVHTPFFRYFKVDLFEECPFWQEDSLCMSRDCGVETEEDESKIPYKWRAQALSSLNDVQDANDSNHPACFARVSDFCYTPDDSSPSGVYVDLARNPERFTGYSGPSAQRVWDTIYKENCFGVADFFESSGRLQSGVAQVSQAPPSLGLLTGAGGALGAGQPGLEPGFDIDLDGENDMCVEKRVYYKLISGLHSSISMHICSEWLNQETGEWSPNLDCFTTKLSQYPERIQNIYFLHALLTRAVARARPLLDHYDTSVGDGIADALTRQYMNDTMDRVTACGDTFQEGTIFDGGPGKQILKEEFKAHFRNVSRIMDCVGCDKCRLWGKVQVSGIGAALKILFGLDGDEIKQPNTLQRSEVVALFNTFHRISESIENIEVFRKLYEARKTGVATQAATENTEYTEYTVYTWVTRFGWLVYDSLANAARILTEHANTVKEYAREKIMTRDSALAYESRGMSANKKGGRKSEPFVAGDAEHKYNEGDIVLGKIKGYPAWPGKIIKSENVPPRVQRDKPKKKKDVYAIRFYPTGEYMWANTKEMSALTKGEITKYLDDSSKKREGDLRKGYQIALDPVDWEEEHERRLAEMEAEDELDDEEDEEAAGSKRRSKGTGKSSAKKTKTEHRKTNKVTGSDVEDETDEPTKVKSWRHELQRIFLGFEPVKAEVMPKADAQYKMIEGDSDVSVEAITTSKINKVLKRIIGMENIPEDNEYKIRERSQVLYDKFEKILAANGADEKKEEEEGEKEEKKEGEQGDKKEGEQEEMKVDEEKKEENDSKEEKVDEKVDENADKPAEEDKEDKKENTDNANNSNQADNTSNPENTEKPADQGTQDTSKPDEKAEKTTENGTGPDSNQGAAGAPTPQNTPLNAAPLGREGYSRPTVAAIGEDEAGESSAAANLPVGALQQLMQGRLAGLVGKSSGYIESLPEEVKQRVSALKALQSDHNKIESQFQKEILELEKKFALRYEPIYQRRKMLIAGEQEPSPEELIKGEEVDKEDGLQLETDEQAPQASESSKQLGDVKGIPQFWLTALQNHPGIADVINERDNEALERLVDIRLSYLPQPGSESQQAGFQLTFHFAENDYFSNSALTKTYYYQDEVGYTGDFIYDRAEGCEISWKGEDGEKDLTKRIEVKKQRNKNTNRTRVVKKVVPDDSFFNFFNPPKPPHARIEENEDEEEEDEMAELDERLEMDFSLGEELKERVIPRAVDYFTGKALEFTNMADDEDFESEDEDEDEDDDDDEDAPQPPPQGEGGDCKNQ
ncbi:hypothetical protein E3P91_02963 [Wallemia ichthyophaga]|nr:hypothetical protein E3P91_02963 [Wallemia ichthyophaga]